MNNRELIEKFCASARNAVASVEVIESNAESLCNALSLATRDDEFVLLAEPNDLHPELFSKYKLNSNVVTQPTKEQLSTVRTGITDAFAGIASTGSVCVSVTNNFSSPVSMLTRKHIVVLDSKSIIPMPRNIFDENYLDGKVLKRSFTFITGPSATADMGPLVRGVHGPGKLHIIVLE